MPAIPGQKMDPPNNSERFDPTNPPESDIERIAASEVLVDTGQKDGDSPRPKRFRRAIVWSVLAHLIGGAIFLFWYLPNRDRESKTSAQVAGGQSDSSALDRQQEPKPNPAPLVPAEQIEKAVEKEIAKSEELPAEEKLSKLEKNLKRLESLSNPNSVKRISEKIGSSLGLNTKQYAPKKEVVDGRFDFDTAQLMDVDRIQKESGGWEYQATLVDAEGRQFKSSMTDTEGSTMYETFKQMKKYPMAAGIYRSVVMPMLQKMMEAERLAKQAAVEAQRMEASNQDSVQQSDTGNLDINSRFEIDKK